ncbi:hypothetical protein THIOKS13330018 [Thiocapsa sp. KS1]|nr:hypothetical protein THIOKS13330018 [Thiocapsa sp. KS1]
MLFATENYRAFSPPGEKKVMPTDGGGDHMSIDKGRANRERDAPFIQRRSSEAATEAERRVRDDADDGQ